MMRCLAEISSGILTTYVESPARALMPEETGTALISAAVTIPVTSMARARTAVLFLQDRRRAGVNHLGQFRGIPIGQADTAMRRGAADHFGFRRTVNAVVF